MSQNRRDVKFERDLLKTNEDIAPQSRLILQKFVWCIQTSVNFRHFLLRSVLAITLKLGINWFPYFKGALSSSVNGTGLNEVGVQARHSSHMIKRFSKVFTLSVEISS